MQLSLHYTAMQSGGAYWTGNEHGENVSDNKGEELYSGQAERNGGGAENACNLTTDWGDELDFEFSQGESVTGVCNGDSDEHSRIGSNLNTLVHPDMWNGAAQVRIGDNKLDCPQ